MPSNAGVGNNDPYWKQRPLACRLGRHGPWRCDLRSASNPQTRVTVVIVYHRCQQCPYSRRVPGGIEEHAACIRWEREHQL